MSRIDIRREAEDLAIKRGHTRGDFDWAEAVEEAEHDIEEILEESYEDW